MTKNRMPKKVWTSGKKSILYLIIGVVSAIAFPIITLVAGEFTVGGLLALLVMPGICLLVLAFILSVLSIMNNEGRKQGIFTLSCIFLIVIAANINTVL